MDRVYMDLVSFLSSKSLFLERRVDIDTCVRSVMLCSSETW